MQKVKMKRALMNATVPSMIGQFNMNNIRLLQELGYKVDVACNFVNQNVWAQERLDKFKHELKSLNVECFQIDYSRSFINIKDHARSYREIKKLLETNSYDLVHTHTPISSFIIRVANKKSNSYTKTKMIYTAHGFHFFKGNNPIKNFIFRNIEKYAAQYTDVLITINHENYEAAKKFKLKKSGKVEIIPGVGIDVEKYKNVDFDYNTFKKSLGISQNLVVVASVGELNKNKNHKTILKALSQCKNKNWIYVICGIGPEKDSLEKLARELGCQDRFKLLGYRTDLNKILSITDIFAFPSLREGLGLAAIEAMASECPIITSNVNGINEYSKDTVTGFSCSPLDVNRFSEKLDVLMNDKQLRERMGTYNQQAAKQYDVAFVNLMMKRIYKSIDSHES